MQFAADPAQAPTDRAGLGRDPVEADLAADAGHRLADPAQRLRNLVD